MLLLLPLSWFCFVLPGLSADHEQVLLGPKVTIKDNGAISFNKASLEQFVSDLSKGKYKVVDDVYKSFGEGKHHLVPIQSRLLSSPRQRLDQILLLRQQEIRQILEQLKNGDFETVERSVTEKLVDCRSLNSNLVNDAVLMDISSWGELLKALKQRDRNGAENILSRYSITESPSDPNYDPNSKLVVVNRSTLEALLKHANLKNLDEVKTIMNNKVIQPDSTIERQQPSENTITFSDVMRTQLVHALIHQNMEEFKNIISELVLSNGTNPKNNSMMMSLDLPSLVNLLIAIKAKNVTTIEGIIYKSLFPSAEYQAKIAQMHKNALLVLEPTTKDILSMLQMNQLDLVELILYKILNDASNQRNELVEVVSEDPSPPSPLNSLNPLSSAPLSSTPPPYLISPSYPSFQTFSTTPLSPTLQPHPTSPYYPPYQTPPGYQTFPPYQTPPRYQPFPPYQTTPRYPIYPPYYTPPRYQAFPPYPTAPRYQTFPRYQTPPRYPTFAPYPTFPPFQTRPPVLWYSTIRSYPANQWFAGPRPIQPRPTYSCKSCNLCRGGCTFDFVNNFFQSNNEVTLDRRNLEKLLIQSRLNSSVTMENLIQVSRTFPQTTGAIAGGAFNQIGGGVNSLMESLDRMNF